MRTDIVAKLQELLQAEDVSIIRNEVEALAKEYKQEAGASTEATEDAGETAADGATEAKAESAADQTETQSTITEPVATPAAVVATDEATQPAAEADARAETPVEAAAPVLAQTPAEAETTAEAPVAAAAPVEAQATVESTDDADADQHAIEAEEDSDDSEAEDDSPEGDETDQQFRALMADYRSRMSAWKKAKAEEQATNLKAKQGVIDELSALVKDEENIGRLFQNFRRLQDTWKEIGEIPSAKYKDIQREYSRLVEDFYYNVKIYKELKEHDLKKNLELKREIIDKMKLVAEEKSIRKADELARRLTTAWDEIGPTHQEEWEKLREEFREAGNVIFDRVRAHYQALRETQKANLEAKEALCVKAEALSAELPKIHKKWQEQTQAVLDLQKEWKSIGFASKATNEVVWARFRTACNVFFDAKGAFYNETRGEWDAHKEAKEKLIAKALELKDSTDWKESGNALVQLQKQWKEVGSAGQRDEQRLWRQFREACDHFFTAKKAHFGGMSERQDEALKAKKAIIAEMEATKIKGDDAIQKAINGFMDRFNKIGHVPMKAKESINTAFQKALDGMYATMEAKGEDMENRKFQHKLDRLKQNGNAEDLLLREKQFFRDRIGKIKDEIRQYENNLGFFTYAKGKEVEKMKADVLSKIEKHQEEIATLKEKMKQLDIAMRPPKEEEPVVAEADGAAEE